MKDAERANMLKIDEARDEDELGDAAKQRGQLVPDAWDQARSADTDGVTRSPSITAS